MKLKNFIKVGVNYEVSKDYRSCEITWSFVVLLKFKPHMKSNARIKVVYQHEVEDAHW